jgi:hypothetical protein
MSVPLKCSPVVLLQHLLLHPGHTEAAAQLRTLVQRRANEIVTVSRDLRTE